MDASPYRNFRGMTWPVPCERLSEIAWGMAWGHEVLPMADRLVAASVITAYCELIQLSQNRRNDMIRDLRKGPGVETTTAERTQGDNHG